MKKFNIAVVGATADTGIDILNTLADRKFPTSNVYGISSSGLVGKEVSFGDEILNVVAIDSVDFSDIDITFFVADVESTNKYSPQAIKYGGNIIVESEYLKLDSSVPIIVPEVNLADAKFLAKGNIIANPCPIAIMLSLVLKPLDNASKINRLIVSTYQSVSDTGKAGMNELYSQTKGKYALEELPPKVFSEQIAFNILPKIGNFDEKGCTTEELKIEHELKKIMGVHISSSITCVRVPVFVGHCISVNVEFASELSASTAEEILSEADGVCVLSLENDMNYITPIRVVGDELIYISRIRNDISKENTLNLWISGDNLRKGKALNAVQIAEELINNYL
ncbi:MAG: aspartate-semialdehyde dehydrogenase [Janthinobacterium lividum]